MTPKWIKKQWIKAGVSDSDYGSSAEGLTVITCFLLYSWIIFRLGYGIDSANDSNKCVVKSIGDVIIAPVYTIGCNLGKDRFKKSLILE